MPDLRVHPHLRHRENRRRPVQPPLLRQAPAPRRRRPAPRRAAAARPRRDCQHPGHPHEHGTRTAYVRDECRCPECTAANTAEWRAATREQMYGAPAAYVDSTEAREHIQALRREGVGVDQIAKLVHTTSTHVREIEQSTRRSHHRPAISQIRVDLAARILALTKDSRSPYSQIEATGTRRRLQALVAVGWPLPELASRLGRQTGRLLQLLSGVTVKVHTAEQVSNLYDRIWDTAPSRDTEAQRRAFEQARVFAAEQDWLPPLAWDDIDSDPDPDPGNDDRQPDPDDLDEIAIERAVLGDHIRLSELTPAEQAEVVRRLTERGRSIRDIADQLATTKRTVSRRRESAASAA